MIRGHIIYWSSGTQLHLYFVDSGRQCPKIVSHMIFVKQDTHQIIIRSFCILLVLNYLRFV